MVHALCLVLHDACSCMLQEFIIQAAVRDDSRFILQD